VRERIFTKAEEMKQFSDGIPYKVLKEIFPKKLNRRSQAIEELCTDLKKMILSGKLKKGQRLTLEGIAQHYNISIPMAHKVIYQLKEDKLIISKGKKGSFVT
jgi:DNA-binding GntR family transcriptional regulator